MTKKVLFISVLFISSIMYSQKAQRIGYIDMDYILENIPEYQEAQSQLDAKARSWQNEIADKEREIETLKADFNNEKALLTNALIEDKQEDIDIKEQELNKLRLSYFGANGSLYFYRQQLVKPIQDLVFNAVQDIAKKRKYDFVLDKSSNLTMLYTNDKFDISDQVIQTITRSKKIAASKNQNIDDEDDIEDTGEDDELSDKAAEKQAEREAKKQELEEKLEAKRAAQKKKREDLKKAIEAKRQKRLKAIEDAKKAKEEKSKQNKQEE